MKWELRIMLFMLALALAFFSVSAVNESDIPSLTNYHQFYGTVSGLPAGSFALRIQAGTGAAATAVIANDGKYGFAEAVKVAGSAGDTVTFKVVSGATGAITSIGEEPYVSGKVQNKELRFPAPVEPAGAAPSSGSQNTTTSNDITASNNAQGGGSGNRDRTSSDQATTIPATGGACLQSWECGIGWSVCQGQSQTRTCVRVDSCDLRLALGEVSSIISIPKPIEQQSCVGTAGAVICPAGSISCQGNNLRQCSADGSTWITINSCPQGCNSATLSCQSAAKEEAPIPKSAVPWLPIGAGVGGLLLAAAVILIILHWKRSGSSGSLQPVKEYIVEARKKGFSDAVIKMKLVAQGWDAEKIEKLLK
ncbi:MAG TPA: hypothetical protein VJH68_05935 [Candidatus Nanoarchaeia archaeon]|nr:hypothetical protein [Candidatus Nanoarchaeia archaeon]